MPAPRPNVLLIMTDEERYPPPYEAAEVADFRRRYLPARERLRDTSVEFHRHYAASTACVPSRASLFTGQYPSLHGARSTDGLAKAADDPGMWWLDPDTVPTMGDWFRAAGYSTHYRGKWHLSHADLVAVGSHVGLATNDREGTVFADAQDAYRRADRLDRFGFSGWVGREPHGADPADIGLVKDPLFAEQVCGLFGELAADRKEGQPWLAVASFVNPHDIGFSGVGWQLLGLPDIGEHVPEVAEAPSQADGFDGRPDAHRLFRDLWPQLLYPQPTDTTYRRLYLWLHQVVDRAIERILDALDNSGMAEDTVVVFTSDHGDLVGAHGGMQQKWYNAYDEAIRVPLLVSGPGIQPADGGIHLPTSHIDLLPTLLGLAGIEPGSVQRTVGEQHIETHPLVGRDLSPAILGTGRSEALEAPVYFNTEDQISRGLRHTNRFTGEEFVPVGPPANVESVITTRADADGADHLWKLSHYYERLDEWEADNGLKPVVPPGHPEPAASQWELYDLTADPEERANLWGTAGAPGPELGEALSSARRAQRLAPRHRN
jgi:arylsulfatase A-like enzyme